MKPNHQPKMKPHEVQIAPILLIQIENALKCHGFGHIASDCPNRKMISLVEEDLEDDVEDEPVDDESEEEWTNEDQGESLVIRRILKSTCVEEDWLRNNIFHTKCTSSGKVCNVIVDGGSCENVCPQPQWRNST
jgi:hypothetical protein